jgi:hypothetical protein
MSTLGSPPLISDEQFLADLEALPFDEPRGPDARQIKKCQSSAVNTDAELQHWEVDLDARTARIVKSGHRQLKKKAARLSIKTLADEIAQKILDCSEDPGWPGR